MPELIQFDKGKSIILYLPPKGTAGFARQSVILFSLVPRPPAKIIARVFRVNWLTKRSCGFFESGIIITFTLEKRFFSFYYCFGYVTNLLLKLPTLFLSSPVGMYSIVFHVDIPPKIAGSKKPLL